MNKPALREGQCLIRKTTVAEVEAITAQDIPKVNREHGTFSRNFGGQDQENVSWWGCRGKIAGVRKLQEEGWPSGVKKSLEAIGQLQIPFVETMRRKRIFGPAGDELNLDRFYRGDLGNAWEFRARRKMAGIGINVTRIYVSVCASASRTGDEFFWRGAAALALIDALESAGRSCELWAYETCTNPLVKEGSDYCISNMILVKESGDPPNLERIATVLCLSGWFRLNLFNFLLAYPRQVESHMGSASEEIPEEEWTPGDIVIADVWDRDAAAKLVREKLAMYERVGRVTC